MTLEDIDRVTVLGAGSMGHEITEVVAIAGYHVSMRDVETELVEDGYEDIEWSIEKLAEKDRIDEAPADVLDRIETTTGLETAVENADFVIEAVPEKLESLQEEHDQERYEPSPYLRELVGENRTGEDAGAGFYRYGDDTEHEYATINVGLGDDGLLAVELDRTARMNALNQKM